MARGWESKAIEDQMEEAKRSGSDDDRESLSPAALELRQRRETLLLSRSRVVEQMARARSEAHRQLLNRTRLFVDALVKYMKSPAAQR